MMPQAWRYKPRIRIVIYILYFPVNARCLLQISKGRKDIYIYPLSRGANVLYHVRPGTSTKNGIKSLRAALAYRGLKRDLV